MEAPAVSKGHSGNARHPTSSKHPAPLSAGPSLEDAARSSPRALGGAPAKDRAITRLPSGPPAWGSHGRPVCSASRPAPTAPHLSGALSGCLRPSEQHCGSLARLTCPVGPGCLHLTILGSYSGPAPPPPPVRGRDPHTHTLRLHTPSSLCPQWASHPGTLLLTPPHPALASPPMGSLPCDLQGDSESPSPRGQASISAATSGGFVCGSVSPGA